MIPTCDKVIIMGRRGTKQKSKTGSKPFRFRGYDWTEVARAMGGENTRSEEDDAELIESRIKAAQLDPALWQSTKPPKQSPQTKETIRLCRRFTKACAIDSEKYHYTAPLWHGLAAIEHDSTFLTYFRQLYKGMWT